MSGQVRPGYKLTEIGVIPEDWQAAQLGQKADIAHGYPFESQYFVERGQYMLTTPGNFYEGGGFRYLGSKQKHYAGPVPNNYLLKSGDLIVAMTEQADGLLGSAALIHDSEKYLHNQRLGRVHLTCSDVETKYLFYVFNSNYYRCKVRETSAGTKVKHTSPQKLREIQIPIPPKSEQIAIAAALSDVDTLISSLDQLIAKKLDIKQAVTQKLLTGHLRLPGFSGAWEVKPMRALGCTYGGLTGKTKSNFGHGDARYIPFMNVITDTVIDPGWLEPVDIAPDEVQNLAKKGDLFFNGSSETPEEVGFCSVLLEDIPSLYLNSFCFGFRFNSSAKVNGLFFAYWFRSRQGRTATSVLAQGATRYNIAKGAFMQLEIPQPSEDEQTAIATVLSDMDGELATLKTRCDKARQIKLGMMQELLIGRVRLK